MRTASHKLGQGNSPPVTPGCFCSASKIGAFEYTFPTFNNLSVNDIGVKLILLGETGETWGY
ncbi:MAG TPA: hypothetical protein VGO67_21460 [Verrucomicrobiae bacterium]